MPMINGFGTWHHGKKNTVSIAAFCEHCGQFGYLSSYDTRTYIVVLFFPLIPLSKLRVLQHCPACKKWNEMKHDKWAALCADVQANAREVVQHRLEDPEAAIRALDRVNAIEDRATFDAIAGTIAQAHSTNPQVLNAVAGGYVAFGQAQIAEKCYMASLKAADSTNAREGLAYARLLQHRATEAAPLLAHLLQQPDARRAFLLYLLARGLQAEGKHDEAIALVETTLARYPELLKEKAWKTLRKTAQKHRGSTKPLHNAALVAAGKPGRDISSVRMIAGTAVLAVLLAGVFTFIAFGEASWRTVHVVNGLPRGYQVKIDGTPYELLADEVMEINLGEGTHTVEANGLRLAEETVTIRTNFWTRAFREEVFAINPDRVAIVLWEKTAYSDKAERLFDDDYEYAMHTNELLHRFPHVHYIFEEFPEEIRMKAGKETKTRVGTLALQPEELVTVLHEELEEGALAENLRRRVHYFPNNVVYLDTLMGLLEPDAFLAEIETERAARPLKMEVHRHYQQVMEGAHPEHNLEAEYEALSVAEPDNADLQYLWGRVTRDLDKAALLMEKAAPSSAYARGALAYGALVNGAFEDAAREIDLAVTAAPDNAGFVQLRQLTWLALGDVARYLESLPKEAGLPADYQTLQVTVHFMGVRGDTEEPVKQLIAKTMAQFEEAGEPIPPEYKQAAMNALMTGYACGLSVEACTNATQRGESPEEQIMHALMRGDVEKAAGLQDQAEPDIGTMGAIYILASEKGLAELADGQLKAMAEFLEASERWEVREVGQVLLGAQPAAPDRLVRLIIEPSLKRVLLTVLAARFPRDRDRYLPLARKLNFLSDYPHFILDAYLTRAGF